MTICALWLRGWRLAALLLPGLVSAQAAKLDTSTALTANSTTLTAVVTPAAGASAIPTGTVNFRSGSISLGSAALNASATATLAIPPYTTGSVTAFYSGDQNFNSSTSAPVVVNSPGSGSAVQAVLVVLTSSANPSNLGQAVTFTALVEPGPTTAPPTGSVQFFNNAVSLGSVALSNLQSTPQAILTTGSLTAGTHTITAAYSGDATFLPASTGISQTVNSLATTLSLAAAGPGGTASVTFGQSVVLTAAIGPATPPAGFNPPSGQITFEDGPLALGTTPLSSGAAALSVATLSAGTHTITAIYGGDTNWAGSRASISVTVAPGATVTTLSLAPGTFGQYQLIAAIAPVPPGTGTPTGRVQFVDTSNNAILAAATLSGGTASVTAAASFSTRPIEAVYSGDPNFQASTSAPLLQIINAAADISSRFAPDEAASIFNVTGLSGDTPASLPLPTSLAGVSVKVTDSAGVSRPAQLYGAFASAGQINFMVPGQTAAGTAALTITLPSGSSVSNLLNIANTAPGIFSIGMNGQGTFAGQVVYAHADGSQTAAGSATPVNLGTATDKVFLVLYGSGIRHAGSVTATVKGVSMPALFAAQGQYPGLDQINLQLPHTLSGSGTVPIVVTADGQPANTVTVTIQ